MIYLLFCIIIIDSLFFFFNTLLSIFFIINNNINFLLLFILNLNLNLTFLLGIQRPLSDIATLSKDCFIPRGVEIPCLNTGKQWQFTPTNFREGEQISGGDIFGVVS